MCTYFEGKGVRKNVCFVQLYKCCQLWTAIIMEIFLPLHKEYMVVKINNDIFSWNLSNT